MYLSPFTRTHIDPESFNPSIHPRIQIFLFICWSSPAPFFWTNFFVTIFSRGWCALAGEIWSRDLLHVNLGDSKGVNYVVTASQHYLWEACQVFRCMSETCGWKRLLHCKSGNAGHVCLDSVCLHVCLCLNPCVWSLEAWKTMQYHLVIMAKRRC